MAGFEEQNEPGELELTQAAVRLEEELLAVYDRYAPGLLRYAKACTHEGGAAEEAVQQVFLNLLAAWRAETEIRDAREWLYRGIRQFFVVNEERLEKREAAEEGWRRESGETTEEDLDAPVRQGEVRRRLARISSPREYEILQLRAEGFSYEEIASILEIHPGTVASTLSRALRKVRRAFREDFG
ncbi:MAG: sigma-70 family RNA polymerase sigma factor [Bryobacteraceae bacterium]|nr:sigma-70 family RNA polymerase sigma factor [Solibacteraceae bacterium]MCL4843995.1 sigma-70 family RNA polymerase sigma factor [Bryobacteraceae bacterium]MCO5353666.1 sigma-70 family RNA polymerase sigma factor [Bryobacteraceae bacterium]